MSEELVGVLLVHKVSKSVVHEVSVMFGGLAGGFRASCSVSVTRISARATVSGDPMGPPVVCL